MAKRRRPDEESGDGGGEVDLEVAELIAQMDREGLRPAMIVFLGDACEPRVATRGVEPRWLLRELARRSRAGRPCRREKTATTRH